LGASNSNASGRVGSADAESSTTSESTKLSTASATTSTASKRLSASERSQIDQQVIASLIADAIQREDFEQCVQFKKYKALLASIEQAVAKENFEECVKLRQEKVALEQAHPAIGTKRDEVTRTYSSTLGGSQENLLEMRRKHSGPSLTATPPPVPDAELKKPNIADAVSKAQALWAKAAIKPIPPRTKAPVASMSLAALTKKQRSGAAVTNGDADSDSSPDLDFDAEGSDDIVRKKAKPKASAVQRMGTWTGGHTLSSFYKLAAAEDDDESTEELSGEQAAPKKSAKKKKKVSAIPAGVKLSRAGDVEQPKKKKKVKKVKKAGGISIAADLEQAKKDLSELKLADKKPKKKKKKKVAE
jgi:hypothetical protein